MRKFLIMQNKYYKTALNEIKSGEKKTHWIWFIFPQLRGLGVSQMSYKYGLQNLDEAKEYFRNKKLRQNLLEITTELYALKKRNIIKIVGEIDAMKIQACMTLFYCATREMLFRRVLDKYYDGQFHAETMKKLYKF